MARSGREAARKIKSRQATLYSSSGDEESGKKEERTSKISKQELSSIGVLGHRITVRITQENIYEDTL